MVNANQKDAVGLLAKGQFDAAEGLFQHLLSQAPPDSEFRVLALVGLGLCERAQNRPHSAVQYFEESLVLKPNLAAVENLLVLYRELGDEERRKAAAKRALEISVLPTDQRARLVMIAGNA
jgi:tetratricopeptide (TPR) repeat protein